ncbi:MAG: YkgJ family cysteine cluster protein [Nitrospirae bacterium]|nr:MAG: YkgJ family cysteine cluster protein [Nitrospirota bacterium]
MLNMNVVDMVHHTLDHKFKFRCHKDIACFTKCCSSIDIMLTPYDILKLKNRLGISSGDLLSKHAYIHIDEKTSHPFVFLAMSDTAERLCPFLKEGGCSIYEDRPANCRYYPVGQASMKKTDEATNQPVTEEFYFFVKEPHCLGFEEDKEWTIRSWRDDQGVDIYDAMNRGWKDILFRKNLPGHELDEKKQKVFYMACYDLDRFRDFVFKSGFLEKFDVDAQKLEKIKNDETELMKFGFEYTKFILMMEQTLKLKY